MSRLKEMNSKNIAFWSLFSDLKVSRGHDFRQVLYNVGGVVQWAERWSRPVNFPYPAPDC